MNYPKGIFVLCCVECIWDSIPVCTSSWMLRYSNFLAWTLRCVDTSLYIFICFLIFLYILYMFCITIHNGYNIIYTRLWRTIQAFYSWHKKRAQAESIGWQIYSLYHSKSTNQFSQSDLKSLSNKEFILSDVESWAESCGITIVAARK